MDVEELDMTTRYATDKDKDVWDALVTHPLQSWAWGQFRNSTRIRIIRILVFDRHTPVAAWQLSFHMVGNLPFTVGYMPKGPDLSDLMLSVLEKEGRKHRAIYIQYEPDTIVSVNGTPVEKNARLIHDLQIRHPEIIASHRPLFTKYTFLLDLKKSETELLADMHPKTRYNIKIAQKHRVVVREDNSRDAFMSYLKLTGETVKRQGFYAHNTEYHRAMWEHLHPVGIAKLFTASYNNEIIAAWILFLWEKTVYYPYGASIRKYREVMAPNIMLWEIIRWAKNKGYIAFDLWGSLGPDPDRNDPWFGFHRFKAGYAPDLIGYAGSFDQILNHLPYKAFTAADKVRWKVLNFLR